MARLSDLAKDQSNREGGFHRKLGKPFFLAGGIGPEAEMEPMTTQNEIPQTEPIPDLDPDVSLSDPKAPKSRKANAQPNAQTTSPVSRVRRLKGGLPAHVLAQALNRITPTVRPQPKRELLGEVSRGARLDLTTWSEIEDMAGGQRSMAGWAREALLFVSEQGVSPATLRTCAEEIQARRELSGGRGRSLMVALGRTGKATVEVLAKRTNLSEQAVVEGVLELYRKTYQAALDENSAPVEEP